MTRAPKNLDGYSVEELRQLWLDGRISMRADLPEYSAWRNARGRCHNPNDAGYRNYGGRGVTMHPTWINDFWAFFRHIGRRPKDCEGYLGLRPQWSLDRYPNNNGNYEPGNVRWASKSEQSYNRRPELTSAEGHHLTKLSWEDVKKIRALAGSMSQGAIGEMYGVDQGNIFFILHNQTWYDPEYIPGAVGIPHLKGEEHGSAILTAVKVSWIKLWLFWGYSPSEIADKYGVTPQAIYPIKNGRRWADVPIADPEDCPPEFWPPEAKWPFYPTLGLARRI